MPWTSKKSNGGSNDTVFSDPLNESKHRPYKAGYFYDGNETTKAEDRLKAEGSKGLARNQGMIRTSAIPVVDEGAMGQDNERRIKTQGSHAHLGYKEKKVKRELKG